MISERLRNPLSLFDVRDKVVIITGASGSFGHACAVALGALGGAFVAGVVEDPLRSRFHLAQVLDGCRCGYAVPHGFAIANQIVERINSGLGFEEIVAHGQASVVSCQLSVVGYRWPVGACQPDVRARV